MVQRARRVALKRPRCAGGCSGVIVRAFCSCLQLDSTSSRAVKVSQLSAGWLVRTKPRHDASMEEAGDSSIRSNEPQLGIMFGWSIKELVPLESGRVHGDI
jgi:hypothetical protein